MGGGVYDVIRRGVYRPPQGGFIIVLVFLRKFIATCNITEGRRVPDPLSPLPLDPRMLLTSTILRRHDFLRHRSFLVESIHTFM